VERTVALTGGRLADVVVDVSAGAVQPVLDAIDIVRPGGTVVLAGLKNGHSVPNFVTDRLVSKSITMRGVFTVDTPSYREAIRLIHNGTVPFERFRTETYPLADAEHAIRRLAGLEGDRPAFHVAICQSNEPGRRG
jgi:threonine dehydrogenase-like Zn-dependent dehydrogenase